MKWFRVRPLHANSRNKHYMVVHNILNQVYVTSLNKKLPLGLGVSENVYIGMSNTKVPVLNPALT